MTPSTLAIFFGSPCPWCDIPMHEPTRDHIYPRSLGGGSGTKNTLVICRECNVDKGCLPLFSWLLKLEEASDHRAANVRRFMRAKGQRFVHSVAG